MIWELLEPVRLAEHISALCLKTIAHPHLCKNLRQGYGLASPATARQFNHDVDHA